MSITNADGIIGGQKQKIPWTKTVGRTTVAAGWFTLRDVAGTPGPAASLNPGSPTPGIVPTSATQGFPPINAFVGGTKGYLNVFEFASTAAGRLQLLDRLYHVGQFAFGTGGTVTSAPSYSSRVPGGTDFNGLEMWMEVSVAFVTGNNWNVSVSYTNQSGVSGRTATLPGALAAASLTLGRMLQLNLQAGDSGVQSIQSVTPSNGATAMTAGNFNIVIFRPLCSGRVNIQNDGDTFGFDRNGFPELWATSALEVLVCPDSTSSGIPDCLIDIVSG